MIVLWTIKGNDAFPRFPQGRMISVEFAPQNSAEPPGEQNNPSLHINSRQQRLLIFIDLAQHFLPLHHRPLRSQLPSPQNFIVIPSKDYYLTPFVTLPPQISMSVSHPLDQGYSSCFA